MAADSRETEDKFSRYLALLEKWQKSLNLVSPDTLADARRRHIEDSAQLAAFIPPEARILFDWGSGAGFPGLALAMVRPGLAVHLVESDSKKCAFLNTVSRETETPVTVHNCRIEDIVGAAVPDVITARALAPLAELLALALPWAQRNLALRLLFPKGRQAAAEVATAQEGYSFELAAHPSQTDSEARILEIRRLCIK